MCGRYALRLPSGDVRSAVESQSGSRVTAWEDESSYNSERGYNIPPRTRNPIVLRGGGNGPDGDSSHTSKDAEGTSSSAIDDAGSAKKHSDLRMTNMQWGLIPHWMKRQPDHATALKTINARDDTIVEGSSMWKSIRGSKRCVVLAEGFYEWLKKGTERVPHHVKRHDGQLMFFAGLWDSVTYEGEKDSLQTYTIITTNSNKQISFLHDRMPVILSSAEDIALWLDTSEKGWTPELAKLLKPYEGELDCYIVPREVGKVGQQSADFLKPVAERKGNISSFFAKQTAKAEGSKAVSTSPEKQPSSVEKKTTGDDKAAVKEDDPAEVDNDLLLNPDDDDKIKPASQASSARKKSASPIVLDDVEDGDKKVTHVSKPNSEGSRRQDPVVLDESDSDGDAGAKQGKRKRGIKAKGSPASRPVKKTAKTEKETDEEGNEKLTDFFEVKEA